VSTSRKAPAQSNGQRPRLYWEKLRTDRKRGTY
jgi:hypothetical protein